jgi:hypothetical protein
LQKTPSRIQTSDQESNKFEQPHFGSKVEHAGPLCTDPEGVQGILAYRGECHYAKAQGDDGNPAVTPDIVDGQGDKPGANGGFGGGQTWLATDRTSVPVLTPSSGTLYEKTGSASGHVSGYGEVNGDGHDGQGSPDAGQSNGPTPNSSGASSEPKSHLAPGSLGGTRQEAGFHPSPISPQQNLMNPGAPTDAGNHQSFFGESLTFSMGHNLAGQQNGGFAVPQSWGPEMNGQAPPPNMTPVGEGVLRALMNMGPMDAMDLSSWDSGQDNAMRG